jgi:hypothetical protein
MQGHESTLADAGRYLMLLARTIKSLGTAEPGLIPEDFIAHAYTVFNRRWLQMATPLVMLALFLHPGYRVLSRNAAGTDDFKVIAREVSLSCLVHTSGTCPFCLILIAFFYIRLLRC